MIDKIIALVLLLLLLPLFILIAIIILIFDSAPIIYHQKRVGENNIIFTMYKFRTMQQDSPELPSHLIDEPELLYTFSGKFLRKTSLDEIPQLVNIIFGDMSFIGPRPALHSQKDLIALRMEKRIDSIKPGITGWAQVNGRDDLPITEKVNKDVEYLQKYSFLFDLKILWLTVLKVVKKDGISH